MVMKTKLFITALAIAAITSMASAQEKSVVQDQKAVTQASGNYVDADNNGVCDYYEANGRNNGNSRKMGNARAVHGRQGMAAGQGRGMRSAQGRGMGPGQGKGLAPGGQNFTDENKNGVCDLRETPAEK
jgi:hypothetical protein